MKNTIWKCKKELKSLMNKQQKCKFSNDIFLYSFFFLKFIEKIDIRLNLFHLFWIQLSLIILL